MRSIIIWSGPSFTIDYLETVIWSGLGFADFFDEVNCYLVGSRLHNKLFGDLVVIWSVSRFHNESLRVIAIWSDPDFTTAFLKGWK